MGPKINKTFNIFIARDFKIQLKKIEFYLIIAQQEKKIIFRFNN